MIEERQYMDIYCVFRAKRTPDDLCYSWKWHLVLTTVDYSEACSATYNRLDGNPYDVGLIVSYTPMSGFQVVCLTGERLGSMDGVHADKIVPSLPAQEHYRVLANIALVGGAVDEPSMDVRYLREAMWSLTGQDPLAQGSHPKADAGRAT